MFAFDDKYNYTTSYNFCHQSLCGMSEIHLFLDNKEIVPFKNREVNNYFAIVDETIKTVK
jgi:hypothetical protein